MLGSRDVRTLFYVESGEDQTLRLELVVGSLHDAELWIAGKHLGPFGHALEYLGLYCRVCILQMSV